MSRFPSIQRSVYDLYRRRWDIEVFFKQVKQTLKLSNFLGHSANAVRWQVYTALLVYVLLRFQGFLSAWAHSFTRLFAVVRSAVWERLDLLELLKSYGTASTRERKSRSRKLQLPPLKFRRRLSVKVPPEPRFPQAVGWL